MTKGFDYPGISIVFLCHDGDGNYLMAKRTEQCRDEHGKWDPGAGSLEFGEKIQDALRRELFEEYGVEPIRIQMLGCRDVHRECQGHPTHWVAVDFKVQVDREKVINKEPHKHSEIKWFSANELYLISDNCHSQWPQFYMRYIHSAARLLAIPCEVYPKRVGVAVVIRWNGKILACERQHCRDMNGSWQLPGGGVEGQESALEASYREVEEETGLKPRCGNATRSFLSVGIGVTPDSHPHVTTFYLWDCKTEPKPVNKEPDKHGDWEWVTPKEFLSRPIIELTRSVVEGLK